MPAWLNTDKTRDGLDAWFEQASRTRNSQALKTPDEFAASQLLKQPVPSEKNSVLTRQLFDNRKLRDLSGDSESAWHATVDEAISKLEGVTDLAEDWLLF